MYIVASGKGADRAIASSLSDLPQQILNNL